MYLQHTDLSVTVPAAAQGLAHICSPAAAQQRHLVAENSRVGYQKQVHNYSILSSS